MIESKILKRNENVGVVYDISLDGTFVDAFTGFVCHNTDGFNFQEPKNYRYVNDNPYIGKGLSRETKVGKEYFNFEADLAEFNDTYMHKDFINPDRKCYMGLGLDEVVESTINKLVA